MDAVTVTGSLINSSTKTQVRAAELLSAFNLYKNNISVLSLDCFDTILWRKTITPKDVFYDLQQRPHCSNLKIRAIQRIDAEDQARRKKSVSDGTNEVNLDEIYHTGFPSLTDEQVAALITEEIDAEKAACYAFPAVVEVIRAAHASGLKIIIVSNTYLQEPQLRDLLSHVLPDDVYHMIDDVFASCDYRKSKGYGLFAHVLAKIAKPAQSILHIGDNYRADFEAAKRHGLHALHLLQFDNKIEEWMRLNAVSATLCDQTIHAARPLYNVFRGVMSSANLTPDRPDSLIGYMSMGPIMYAFARYILSQVERLQLAGKRPKVLYLMRDAHLPYLACEALAGKAVGHRIRVSRFTATACSFVTKENIDLYLAGSVYHLNFEDACKQFLLPDEVALPLCEKARAAEKPVVAFANLIKEEKIVQQILALSAEFRAKLKKYLYKQADIQSGDAIILVDLGYVGRTQRALTPLLINEMGAESVTACYLMTVNIPEWQLSRSGLIDPSWCDDRTINLLCLSCALLEELCCSGDDSVVDYDDNGEPIYAISSATTEQRVKVQQIQAECIRFIHDARNFFAAANMTPPIELLRDIVLAEMARRMYLPTEAEVNYLQEFKHDMNKGTDLAFSIFTAPIREYTSLRKQGLWFKNQHPYGLRAAGLEMALTLMAQRRFGFEIRLEDMSLRNDSINVIMFVDQKPTQRMYPASPTHDGFYSLWFPVNAKTSKIAIIFGMHYKIVQLNCADLIKASAFYAELEMHHTKDVTTDLVMSQMECIDEKLYRCTSNTSAIMLSLNLAPTDPEEYILRLVYRPI